MMIFWMMILMMIIWMMIFFMMIFLMIIKILDGHQKIIIQKIIIKIIIKIVIWISDDVDITDLDQISVDFGDDVDIFQR